VDPGVLVMLGFLLIQGGLHMTRDEAFEELRLRISSKEILLHSIATEAVMKEFARYYNADIEIWGLAGLLHDIDYERTMNNPALHGIVGAGILENLDIDGAIVYSVKAHNNSNGIERKRKMDKVLFLADDICDLIIKCALNLPGKKISDVLPGDILNKLNEINEDEHIRECKNKHYDELGLTVEKFVKISLNAMKEISLN
jgi:putative nucleotidyltransferase with HDIG domain